MKLKLLKAFDKIMLRKRAVIESEWPTEEYLPDRKYSPSVTIQFRCEPGLIAYSRQPLKPDINVGQLVGDCPVEV